MRRKTPAPFRETPQPTLPDGKPYPTLGPVVIRWMRRFLVHGEGELLGQPFEPPGWLKRAIYRIFEYDPDTYERIVREALIIAPKGSAKTEGCAAIALAELAGPVVPTPDEPQMRRSPNIPISAASYEQAGRLFTDAARAMVEGTPESPGPLAAYLDTFETEITHKMGRGRMFRVAAVAGTNDGGLPTAAVFDEVHEFTGRKERVHLIISNSLGKRGGLALNITTPDDADPNSLLGNKTAYAEKIATGEVHDPGFYYLRYSAPDGCPLDMPEQVIEAVELAHPAEWVDVKRIADKLLIDRIPVHEFRRYFLAQFVRAARHYLPEGVWEGRESKRRIQPGERVVLGFDGSYRGDSTALVAATVEEQPHVEVLGAWERPDNAPETWTVPRSEVLAYVHEAMDRFDVAELAADPFGWVTELEQLEDAYGEVVVRFETNQHKRMAAACDRFRTLAVHEQLTHDGSSALSRHLHNAVVKTTPSGEVITKEDKDSPRKIDLAVAAIVATDRAVWHHNNRPAAAPTPMFAFV